MPKDAVTQLPTGWFDRVDETADGRFYDVPRFVQHIDEGAIAAVTDTLRAHLRPGGDVLDLMSSWVSHLPAGEALPLGRVVGVGMNAEELRGNPRLQEWIVRDLNAPPPGEPLLPFPDASFDAALITVSIQYLTNPVAVLAEAARVLRPRGTIIVSLSDRMFPTKATRIWQETPADARANLVAHYIDLAGGFDPPRIETPLPPRRFPGDADPLWVVIAERTLKVETPLRA